MEPRPTETLIAHATQGDGTAVDELLERFLPELQAFLRMRAGPKLIAHESISDLAQSVCREVLVDVGGFRYQGDQAFRRWLFLEAERKIRSRARYHGRAKRDRDREVPLDDEQLARGAASLLTPSRVAAGREDLQRFWSLVEALPEEQRRVLALCRGLGMTPSEAAAELGKSANAVRVTLHRALAKIAVLQDRGAADR